MPSSLPSGHRRTFLKLPKSNHGAVIGAGIIAVLVAVFGRIVLAVYQGLLAGTLPLPPSLVPYAPWIVIVLGAIAAGVVQSGVPAFHPGQAQPGAPERPRGG
jgi:hypothetical protein